MTTDDRAVTIHIGEVAERTELSLRTLRHYDDLGLVRPSDRTEGGFRLYTAMDIERLMLIRRMKPLGYTLAEMRELLSLVDAMTDPAGETPELRALLAGHVTAAQQRREALTAKVEMADEFLAILLDRLSPQGRGSGGGARQ